MIYNFGDIQRALYGIDNYNYCLVQAQDVMIF